MSLEINTHDEERQRAAARAKVSAAARDGQPPHAHFGRDLNWAFEGREDELARLETMADEVIASRHNAHQARMAQLDLEEATKRVLAEWDEAEKRDRYQLARAEATKRLAAAAAVTG